MRIKLFLIQDKELLKGDGHTADFIIQKIRLRKIKGEFWESPKILIWGGGWLLRGAGCSVVQLAGRLDPTKTHSHFCQVSLSYMTSYLSSVGNLPVREVNLQLIDFPLLIKVNADCWSCHNLGGDCEALGKLSRRHLDFFLGGWLVSGQLSGAPLSRAQLSNLPRTHPITRAA